MKMKVSLPVEIDIPDYVIVEIRNKAIEDFAELLKGNLVRKYANGNMTQQYVALQVTDWCNEIAEQLKERSSDDVCEWKLEDEESNLYVTECEKRHLIFDGTPKENGYSFCQYCGKKIKVVELNE